jgi:hypothetical protein
VEALLPVLVDVVWAWRPWHEAADALCPLRPPLSAFRHPRVDVEETFDGVAQECTGQSSYPPPPARLP